MKRGRPDAAQTDLHDDRLVEEAGKKQALALSCFESKCAEIKALSKDLSLTAHSRPSIRLHRVDMKVMCSVDSLGLVQVDIRAHRLSRGQRKAVSRQARYAKIKELRPIKRQEHKQRQKARRMLESPFQRGLVNSAHGQDRSTGEQGASHHHLRGARLRNAVRMLAKASPIVWIDLSDEHLMADEDVHSLVRQIQLLYAENTRAVYPLRCTLSNMPICRSGLDFMETDPRRRNNCIAQPPTCTSIPPVEYCSDVLLSNVTTSTTFSTAPSNMYSYQSGITAQASVLSNVQVAQRCWNGLIKNQGFANWVLDLTTASLATTPFNATRVCYLTAEAETTLTELNSDILYVIGGLVDHNRLKGYCHSKAQDAGYLTAHLPIDECLNNIQKYRRVITVNQVFACLLAAYQQQKLFPDHCWRDRWSSVFEAVLPKRQKWQSKVRAHTPAISDVTAKLLVPV